MSVWSVVSAHSHGRISKTAVHIGNHAFSRGIVPNVTLSNLRTLDLSVNDLTGVTPPEMRDVQN